MERTYSTRELAQMWNVSESTVKRWTDRGGLGCYRTPGGHRRFTLYDIRSFQQSRGFEATGMLSTEDWLNPEVEKHLNQKNFRMVGEQIFYLAARNQRSEVRALLERFYLRGTTIVELYDRLLMPVARRAIRERESKRLSDGLQRVLLRNLDEAAAYLFPRMIRRRANGRTCLCANPEGAQCLLLRGVAQILESEGWDCLNLGCGVPFLSMAEMVESEPVNLVCVVSGFTCCSVSSQELKRLASVTDDYRIPVSFCGQKLDGWEGEFEESYYFENLQPFRDLLLQLS